MEQKEPSNVHEAECEEILKSSTADHQCAVIYNLFMMAKDAVEQLERIKSLVDEKFEIDRQQNLKTRFKKVRNLEDHIKTLIKKNNNLSKSESSQLNELELYTPDLEDLDTDNDVPEVSDEVQPVKHHLQLLLEDFNRIERRSKRLEQQLEDLDELKAVIGEILVTHKISADFHDTVWLQEPEKDIEQNESNQASDRISLKIEFSKECLNKGTKELRNEFGYEMNRNQYLINEPQYDFTEPTQVLEELETEKQSSGKRED